MAYNEPNFTEHPYDIDTAKKISAEGVRRALDTKENEHNKQKTGALNGSSDADLYPSSRLVGQNLDNKANKYNNDINMVQRANELLRDSGSITPEFPGITRLRYGDGINNLGFPSSGFYSVLTMEHQGGSQVIHQMAFCHDQGNIYVRMMRNGVTEKDWRRLAFADEI